MEPGRWTSSRTGFYVFDVASGKGSWAEVRLAGDNGDDRGNEINSRQDFASQPTTAA